MKFEDLLPIGSVVLLKNGKKKIVVAGVMQVKQMDNGETILYDYMGVPYPEGYMNRDTGLLFNHDNIQEIVFKGYADEERENFINVIKMLVDKTDEIVKTEKA